MVRHLQGFAGAIAIALIWSFPAARAVAQTKTSFCPAQLEAEIGQIINQPGLDRANWGIQVQPLQQGQAKLPVLYDRNGQRYFTPASTTKLLTAAAALQVLGPDFRTTTEIYGAPGQTTSQLASLRLVGGGDPTLTTADLQAFAQALYQCGVRRVDRLLVDDRRLGPVQHPPTWAWEDVQAGYGAAVGSLILNQNAIGLTLIPQGVGQPLAIAWADPAEGRRWQVTNATTTVPANQQEYLTLSRDLQQPSVRLGGQLQVGSAPAPVTIAVADPTNYLLQQFRQALNQNQIQVGSMALATEPTPATENILLEKKSPPLTSLLPEMLQNSNNLYAEMFLRWLGPQPAGADPLGDALARQRQALTMLGVESSGYQIADGSGLSRHNLISPTALVQTLQAMAQTANRDRFRRSLAVSGRKGTLGGRLTEIPDRVQAKTGTLSGISALAGYLDHPDYGTLVFAILVNQTDQPTGRLRQAIDSIVLTLARLRRC